MLQTIKAVILITYIWEQTMENHLYPSEELFGTVYILPAASYIL